MNNGRKGGELAARLWDTTFAVAGLIVLWPLFAAVAVLILMADGRPILFRHLLWMTGRYSFFPRGFSRERILRAPG